MESKRCPFCLNRPIENWNSITKEYTIQCEECSKKGITLKIISKTKEEAQGLWNNRKYDDYIVNHPDEIIEKIKEYNKPQYTQYNELKNINDCDKDSIISFNVKHDGIYIMPNLDILICKDNHINELLNYLNISTDERSYINTELMVNFKIIRISIHDRCISISFNKNKISKKQMDKAIEVLCKQDLSNIVCFYSCVKNDTFETKEFDNINDLVLYLDCIK